MVDLKLRPYLKFILDYVYGKCVNIYGELIKGQLAALHACPAEKDWADFKS